MPFERPTLRELGRQALADMAAALDAFAILRTSPLAAVTKAAAGLVHGLYGYLDWIAKQAVPVSADGEYLAAWAGLVGIYRKGASFAGGMAAFTGTVGAELPNGSKLVRSTDGATFITTALATISSAGTLTVPIVAEVAGSASNGPGGAELVIATAVNGVLAKGAAAGAITGGAEEEAEEEFRQRMLDRFQQAPQGGSEADYLAWALEVPGITRAWVAPLGMGAGTVVVYVMLDSAQAANGGFPQGTNGVASEESRAPSATGDQLAVADHIFPLRPVTALVYVVAPTPFPINYQIGDLAQDSVETRAAIQAELSDMLRRRGRPGGTIYQSDSAAAISAAPGVTRFTLVAPLGSVTAPAGSLPTLGTITWS
ncbi:baseplate J/gp47 family protein [Roseomonas sp. USHLN139]|uniref:baseplate J/gp47 family protein n=1 Tax=Roseomonas sp. USHLN139 TaxID=3081298 RepID=UPI003B019E38